MSTTKQRQEFSFQLIRYVPDPVRNEFVHIGVLMQGSSSEPGELRFTREWSRVKCLDPHVDLGLLEDIETELRGLLRNDADGRLSQILSESLSLNVQVTEPKSYFTESVSAGIEELMSLYVDPPREQLHQDLGVVTIRDRMRAEFERVGVWQLLRTQIPVSDYTLPGDTLRIDAGYSVEGLVRMFHAIGFESGTDSAKALSFSLPVLRKGVERLESKRLELSAIVESARGFAEIDHEVERQETYSFGVRILREAQIEVLTVDDLPAVAEKARAELRNSNA